MKLKNKKTGEIVEVITGDTFEVGGIQIRSLKRNPQIVRYYPSLAELNEEWEDVPEEPKPWWYIDITLVVKQGELFLSNHVEQFKTVGNYFETREEAEKAVEKLKAWKRLKDKGFRFEGWEMDGTIWFETKKDEQEWSPKYRDDLDLLFGGEE